MNYNYSDYNDDINEIRIKDDVRGGFLGQDFVIDRLGLKKSQPGKIHNLKEEFEKELGIGSGKRKKRQRKFKAIDNGTPIVAVCNEVSKDVANSLGLNDKLSISQIKEQIKKERARFRSICLRGATKIKKVMLRNGSTKKAAMQESQRHKDAIKEGLRKVDLQHKLMALQEFNNRTNISGTNK